MCVIHTIGASAAVRGEVLLLGAQARGVVREMRVRRAARGLRPRGRGARAERRRAAAVSLAASIARPTLHVELQPTLHLLPPQVFHYTIEQLVPKP